jgi:hypothetical protein
VSALSGFAFLLDQELLNLDLRRLVGDYLWDTLVIAYLSTDADVLAAVRFFGVTKFRAITPPNQHRKNLTRVWFVEIDERRIPATPTRVVCTGDFSANSRLLADMILGFHC